MQSSDLLSSRFQVRIKLAGGSGGGRAVHCTLSLSDTPYSFQVSQHPPFTYPCNKLASRTVTAQVIVDETIWTEASKHAVI